MDNSGEAYSIIRHQSHDLSSRRSVGFRLTTDDMLGQHENTLLCLWPFDFSCEFDI